MIYESIAFKSLYLKKTYLNTSTNANQFSKARNSLNTKETSKKFCMSRLQHLESAQKNPKIPTFHRTYFRVLLALKKLSCLPSSLALYLDLTALLKELSNLFTSTISVMCAWTKKNCSGPASYFTD